MIARAYMNEKESMCEWDHDWFIKTIIHVYSLNQKLLDLALSGSNSVRQLYKLLDFPKHITTW